jgi:stage V sporulation protein R
MNKPLFTGSDWNFSLIDNAMSALEDIAGELKLDIYPNQLEIVGSEQMIDAYASVGLPVMYRHWSFGKKFSREYDLYKHGKTGLAYELVLNTNPCINFLMEENSACTQVLVLAHAAFGHNHFFKNNHLFRQWTDAESIIDYLVFAKNYITECEQKYGYESVEKTLDAAHSLIHHGVNRFKRPPKLSLHKEKERQAEREKYLQEQVNLLWRTIPVDRTEKVTNETENKFLKQPEENILYFLEKNSPVLEIWQREILRIVRKISQYFYPQYQTKVANEGWASFVHYQMMNRLWDQGYLTDGAMLEFFQLHTSVLYQPEFDSRYYTGLNPYYLGFEIFNDIKRICSTPDSEDEELFPDLVGTNWVNACLDAVANYRDESFIRQYLSPKVAKKMKLFLLDDDNKEDYQVRAIHNETGFREIRKSLADQYVIDNYFPRIEIIDVDHLGNRRLTLQFFREKNRQLSRENRKVIRYIEQLWGFRVELVDQDGNSI